MHRSDRRINYMSKVTYRGFEILLGVAVALLGALPVKLFVDGLYVLSLAAPNRSVLEVLLPSFFFFIFTSWCWPIAWRLLTGRQRQGGGLLPPTIITLTGFAASVIGGVRRMVYGGGWPTPAEPADSFTETTRRRDRRKRRRGTA
jgi:hypothetical protein